MLNGLDLFSGIGGLAEALAPWVRPFAYCENDKHAQKVLVSRMGAGELSLAPIWDDVRTLNREILAGHSKGQHDDGETIDIISAGFPCQGFSQAGLGLGLEDERSGLFSEVNRLTSELQPHLVYLENVPAITTRGGTEVVGAFTSMGYDCRWLVIPSGHGLNGFRGNRWFLLAKAKSEGLETRRECSRIKTKKPVSAREMQTTWLDIRRPTVEPGICGITYGLPNRVDRIKRLGNSVVPYQARKAFEILSGLSA